MALGRQQMVQRGQNSIGFRPRDKRLGPVSNTIILIVLACLLGLVYLTQVTKTNAYGYTINSLEKQQTQLKDQHDDLAVASARLQSLDRVQNSQVAQAMSATHPSGSVQ
jgi:hypothetical protein